ncbi:MAG: hypothetical protein MI924_21850 [Chloroflexales bacterium]|nr:hypothetical protein [Chloroflexales bacterium]
MLKHKLVIGTMSLALSVAIAASANASLASNDDNNDVGEGTVCETSLGAVAVKGLVVPDGASCTLDGTMVEQDIFVGSGANLVANAVKVGGDIQGKGAKDVQIMPDSVVGGDIQLKEGGSATMDHVKVRGDVQLELNSRMLNVSATVVGGSLQVFKNTGGVTLNGNQVIEDIQCKENTPDPTGGENSAGNKKEDQCAQL